MNEIQSQFPLRRQWHWRPGSDVSLITEIDFAAIKDATEAGELQIAWGRERNLEWIWEFFAQ